MPKEFTIDDAIDGGRDNQEMMYNNVFHCIITVSLIILIILCLWKMSSKSGTASEHATNSNAAVGLQEFSAGSVGAATSAPLDLYSQSVYARNLQDTSNMNAIDIDPTAAPGAPNSASWFVLHSDIVQCGSAPSEANPWRWQRTDYIASNEAKVESHPAVAQAKQTIIAANPTASPADVESAPLVVQTKQAVSNAIANAPAGTGTASVSAGAPGKTESFLVGDKCPTVGNRIQDLQLTQALMGF